MKSVIRLSLKLQPVVVAAEGAAQINDAITWGKAEGIKLVIRGGRDALFVADRLKAENVPVILTSTMSAPDRQYESYDNAYATPGKLHAAGVKFAIAGGSGALYSYRLPWEAGVAVAFGLPEEEALKAVTINAAEFMGIADRVGCRSGRGIHGFVGTTTGSGAPLGSVTKPTLVTPAFAASLITVAMIS